MPNATLHIEDLGGWAGYTRVYKLDPPRYFGEHLTEYVTICLMPASRHCEAEVVLVAATDRGVSIDGTVRKRVGSFTPESAPRTQADIQGCFGWALLSIGGYEIVAPTASLE